MKVFYINPDSYSARRKGIEKTALSISADTKRVITNEIYDGIILTVCRAHLKALNEILNANTFPCILLEDDAAPIKPLPDIEWPQCDIIYLGGSTCGTGTRIEPYNKDFYRVFNMLSFHAVMFTNIGGVKRTILSVESAIQNKCYNDVQIALNSEEYLYLTPKDGLYLFQDNNNKQYTHFQWREWENKK